MEQQKRFKVCSLFSGIGGIDLGFEKEGFEIVWANDIDHFACQTYRHNNSNVTLIEGDIKSIDKSAIPSFDVLVAGFPCQPFSVAGPQKGFEDKRGNLFYQIMDVVRIHKPPVVFLENVANLIDHDNGKTFITMFNSFSELDYLVRYRTLPANEYGNTPQTRNRTYVVAFNNEAICNSFSFPEPIDLSVSIFDIIHRHQRQKDIFYYSPDDPFWEYLTSKVTRNDSIYRIHDSGIHLAKNFTCPTLTASMGTRKNFVPVLIDDFGYRKLTVRECLDLQGFPMDFSFPPCISMQEAYKQIGNSVCVNVIARLAKQIKTVLEQYT